MQCASFVRRLGTDMQGKRNSPMYDPPIHRTAKAMHITNMTEEERQEISNSRRRESTNGPSPFNLHPHVAEP